MSKTTIEWTSTYHDDGSVTPGYSFNPWHGCMKVSAGCAHCYAETMNKRFGHNNWGPASVTSRRMFGEKHWQEPLKWNAAAEKSGQRARVFCASMADVFEDHPQVEQERRRLFDLIEVTPNLDWLLLTKRPENIRNMVPGDWLAPKGAFKVLPYVGGFPKNIWIGTSVENQEQAEKRIPHLLSVPAHVRFLSCEPLLGPVWLYSHWLFRTVSLGMGNVNPPIKWIIAGGESGHGARTVDPDWIRSLRNQCQSAGVAFFFKQWGSRTSKTNGRLLDDREWNEFPQVER